MGWWFEFETREALLGELLAPTDLYESKAWKLIGSVLWIARVPRVVRLDTPEPKPFIGCILLKRSGGLWGYKPMDESMGPCEVNCPVSYLNMIPDPCEGFSTKWRARVRAFHSGTGPRRVGWSSADLETSQAEGGQ